MAEELKVKVEISESLLTELRTLIDLIQNEQKRIDAALKEFQRQKRGEKA